MQCHPSKIRTLLALLLVTCLMASSAESAVITFHGETTNDTGTGFGNVLKLLALQQKGNARQEAGSVYWSGSADQRSGDATPQSQTQTVAAATAKGFDASDLIVILNINQVGSNDALDVHEFAMRFYTNPAGTQWFDAAYDRTNPLNTASSLGLTPAGQGTGSAGYVFRIALDAAEATAFFADPGNHLGMAVSVAMDNEANNGPDNFYLGDADVNNVVPEPATLVMLSLGAGLAMLRRRARRGR
jgi:hypothetical protein